MSISMVDVAVMSTVGVKVGVFPDVEIRVGVIVGEAKPGADEVFVAGGVEVWVGSPDGTCVAVGVRVFVGTGVSDGGGIGVDVDAGEITVNDPPDKLNATPAPLGSEAAALPRVNSEVPEDALALTLTTILATIPFAIAVWSRPKMITRTVPAAGREYDRVLDAGTAEPLETLVTDRRLLSKVRSKFKPVT